MTNWPVLFIFLAKLGLSTTADEGKTKISDNILNFMTVFNGDWDNQAQIDAGFRDHDLIQVRIVPVDVPCLRPKPVVYAEEFSNGVILNLKLGVITEGPERSIYMTLYGFADSSRYKYKTYDLANLANLKLKDLQTDKECVSAWLPIGNNTFVGNFPICSRMVQGHHPSYSLLFNCKNYYGTVPLLNPERPTPVPYKLTIKGSRFHCPWGLFWYGYHVDNKTFYNRYPLQYSLPNYVNPCEKIDKGIKDACPPA